MSVLRLCHGQAQGDEARELTFKNEVQPCGVCAFSAMVAG